LTKTKYIFLTNRSQEPLESMNTHDAWRVNFSIHPVWTTHVPGSPKGFEEMDETPVLTGRVDWQDGIILWQAEGIEPSDFITIMATAHEAICAARRMIGANWALGGQGEPEAITSNEPEA
jgi:hypothetical protein